MNPPQGNIISSRSLFNVKMVGAGAYGTVYRALWRCMDEYGDDGYTEVAIKVTRNSTKEKVFQERDRMAFLNHVNVIQLYGFVQPWNAVPCLVMEYASRGNLLSYVLEHRGRLSAFVMMRIAWGIGRGMEYLHYQGIVHGDLAARNCFIDRHRNVKIGDLGFHDAKNEDDYMNYNASRIPCPTQWMPPENLPYKLVNGRLRSTVPRHTVKGDIWAYGVVLFEMWSRGEKPFGRFTNYQVCWKVLNKQKPTHECKVIMRKHVRNLMHSCWQFNPNYRPRFSTIVEHFEGYVGFQSGDEFSETSTVAEYEESDWDA